MWYSIKQSLLPFIYLIFTAITAFGIMAIENMVWLQILLNTLNVALYMVIITAASYKDGQAALKVRLANDLEREQIIRTGEMRPLRLKEEYKPWKGFLYGGIACAPLIILLIIHTILVSINPTLIGAGAIASFIYLMIYAYVAFLGVIPGPYTHYLTLLAVPVIVLSVGIPYILGAKKVELQQERIREKHRKIYGDNK